MRSLPCFLLLTLTACAAGNDYQPPPVAPPEAWLTPLKEDAASPVRLGSEKEESGRWWETFNDPVLDTLVELAIGHNQDLQAAEARLRAARADYLGASANLLPELSISGKANRGNQGYFSGNKPINLYQAQFDAAWEIDIFGGLRRKEEAAEALVQASAFDREAVRLSLIAELCRNYIDARNAQRQIIILHKNLNTQAGTLQLIESLQTAGLASDIELARADAEYRNTESRLPALQTSLTQALGRLNTLSGSAFGNINTLMTDPQAVPTVQKMTVLETPAASLMLRPDVARSERQLAAAAALHGSALANRYPKITLAGLFGWQNTSILSSTKPWSAGAEFLSPLIDSGRISSLIDAADAKQSEALAAYRQTILLAVEETENAFTAYINETGRVDMLEKAVASSAHAADMAKERYQSGVIAFIDVLDAERTQYEAESALADAQAGVSKNAVALYKAMGGVTAKAAASSATPSQQAPFGSDGTAQDSPTPPAGVLLDNAVQ